MLQQKIILLATVPEFLLQAVLRTQLLVLIPCIKTLREHGIRRWVRKLFIQILQEIIMQLLDLVRCMLTLMVLKILHLEHKRLNQTLLEIIIQPVESIHFMPIPRDTRIQLMGHIVSLII